MWAAIMAAFALLLSIFGHHDVTVSLCAVLSIEVLSFLVALAIARRESNPKNKVIFVNFALFFGMAFVGMIGTFIGTSFFQSEKFAKPIFDQYLLGGYAFFLIFGVAYISVDVLFRDFRVLTKYALTLVIVGGLFVYYFHPFLADPLHAYHTQDALDWRTLDSVDCALTPLIGHHPNKAELSEVTVLYLYDGRERVAVLQPDAKTRRVAELYPYLADYDAFQSLMIKPIMLFLIKMSIAGIGFILLFFGYLYMKDPPQGAYIEKVMFLLLIYCSMEVLHCWSAINTVEWKTLSDILSAGQYASIVVLILIALYLSLRLRFISSVKGEFYENELSQRPTGITRWRDTLDNLVVESFFNRHTLMGRLFAVPEHQQRQHLQSRNTTMRP
jgi:hypothetical protein